MRELACAWLVSGTGVAYAEPVKVVTLAEPETIAVAIENVMRSATVVGTSQLMTDAAQVAEEGAFVRAVVVEPQEFESCGASLVCRLERMRARRIQWLLLGGTTVVAAGMEVDSVLLDVEVGLAAAAEGSDDAAIEARAAVAGSGAAVVLASKADVAQWRRRWAASVARWVVSAPRIAPRRAVSVRVTQAAEVIVQAGGEQWRAALEAGDVARVVGVPAGPVALRVSAEDYAPWEWAGEAEAVVTLEPTTARSVRRALFVAGASAMVLGAAAWTVAGVQAASATPRTCVAQAGPRGCDLGLVGLSSPRIIGDAGGLSMAALALGLTTLGATTLTSGLLRGEGEVGPWEWSAALAVGAGLTAAVGVAW